METMSKINSFEDLIVWQKSIDLSVEIYRITAKFPKEEMFGLTSQIRRSANSVSLNISEGSVKSTRSFINQLVIANGSAAETLSASVLANKLYFLSDKDLIFIRERVAEVTKIINSLISSLEKKLNNANHSTLSTNH
jgi:four helix bundle protein